jgi:hypothetical protein
MGEIAESVLDGFLCQECFSPMPDDLAPGYPRTCPGCGGDDLYPPARAVPAKKKRRKKRKIPA